MSTSELIDDLRSRKERHVNMAELLGMAADEIGRLQKVVREHYEALSFDESSRTVERKRKIASENLEIERKNFASVSGELDIFLQWRQAREQLAIFQSQVKQHTKTIELQEESIRSLTNERDLFAARSNELQLTIDGLREELDRALAKPTRHRWFVSCKRIWK